MRWSQIKDPWAVFSIKSETEALGSLMATVVTVKTKVSLKEAVLRRGKSDGDVPVPLSSNVISQDFCCCRILLIGFDSELQELLQCGPKVRRKLHQRLQIQASPFRFMPTLSWWVAGVLRGSSGTWPGTGVSARPLLQAEVSRQLKWLFF